jgi:serralysin
MASRITPDSLLVGNALGWHDGDRTLTYAFITQVPGYYARVDTNGDGRADSYLISEGDTGEADFTVPFGASVAMGRAEAALTRQALKEWAEVANLNLVEVKPGSATGADITLGSFKFNNTDTFGFVADFPDGSVTDIGPATLGRPSVHGDFWINTGNPQQVGAVYGNTGWQTYLHELGHAFGLHHPNDDGEPNTPVTFHNNQYTVMSYVPHPGMEGVPDADQDWPITPMLYDIAAIQKLYGANLTTRAGATTYFGTNGAYALKDGGLLANGRTAILTVWDAGGIDTIDASNQTGSVRIDLNPGAFSTIGQVANNIGLALAHTVDGVVVNLIENARGGSAADILVGNVGSNTLDGGAGADRMTGGAGNDTFLVDDRGDRAFEKVGGGSDKVLSFVSYALSAGQQIEALQLLTATGSARLNLVGNEFGQTLVGNTGANVLDGGLGLDVLVGRGGADTFVFAGALGAGNLDHITDFATVDTIRLSESVFSALAPGQLTARAFKDIAKARVDADDHILYDSRNGSLFYDADGSGKAAAVKFAVLDNKAAITHADFLIA